MTTASGPVGTGAAGRDRQLAVGTLVAGCLAVCVSQIALAMPATLNGLFQADLHPIGSQLTWISDAFLLPTAVLELTFGVLGDLFGRKRLLVIGGAILTVGAVVSATANGVHQLWVGQALAGLGAAALVPSSLAAIAAGTPGRRARARGIAAWTGALSLGGMLAPILGGVTGNYGSWRWAFIVLIILAALTTLVSLTATESSAPEGRSLDWGGQVTIAVGLFALLYSVIEGQTAGWGSPTVVTGFCVAAVFVAGFIAAERRARSPMLRLDLFRNRSFVAAALVAVIGMLSYLGSAYAISIRMGPIQHQSPLRNAFPYLLLNGITPVIAPLIARLLERVAPRWLLSAGLCFMAAGQFWMATVPITDRGLAALVGPFVLVGIGFGFVLASFTAAAVNTVPLALAGMASGATSQLRDFGFTLGPAVIGSIALGRAASSFTRGLAHAGLSSAQQHAVTAVAHAGGPLAVNSATPGSPVAAGAQLAQSSLGHGYAIGFVVCGVAALVAAVIGATLLGSGPRQDRIVEPALGPHTAPA